VGSGEIPVDLKRSLEFGNALPGPVGVDVEDAQAQMSRSFLRRDRKRPDRKGFGCRQSSGAVVAQVHSDKYDACKRRADDRIDVAGIERQRALEKLSGVCEIV
jgi:hypothetical protein